MLERMEKWVVTGPRLLYCGHARYSLVLGPGGGMCVGGGNETGKSGEKNFISQA